MIRSGRSVSDDIDDPVLDNNDLANRQTLKVACNVAVRQRYFLDLGLIKTGGNCHFPATLTVDLNGQGPLILGGERRITDGPRCIDDQTFATQTRPALFGQVGREGRDQARKDRKGLGPGRERRVSSP